MIFRLDKNDAAAWHLYPSFETRVRNFAKRSNTEDTLSPILAEMQQRWVGSNNLSGYFVDQRDDGSLAGHLVSWVHSYYNTNRFFIYQAEMDDVHVETLELFMSSFHLWLDSVNETLLPAYRVTRGEFITDWKADIWARYLKRVNVAATRIRTVIEVQLS